jgi:soluble lytic murein transglycosylase-like protein
MMLNLILDIYFALNTSLKPFNRMGQVLSAETVISQQDLDLASYMSLSLTPAETEDRDKIALAKQIDLKQKSNLVEQNKNSVQAVKAEINSKENRIKEVKVSEEKTQPKSVLSLNQLDPLFTKYSQEYGVSKTVLIKIAACESGFNPNAQNGPYAGMFQFLSNTWISNRRAMGLDASPNLRYNAKESIKTAAFKISKDGTGAWPVCSR